jgi:hypothetical protein
LTTCAGRMGAADAPARDAGGTTRVSSGIDCFLPRPAQP